MGELMVSRVTIFCGFFGIAGSLQSQTEKLPPGMPEVMRNLDRIASEAVKNPADAGYTLAVVTRSGLAWTKSYGFADVGRQRAASDLRLGSDADRPEQHERIGSGAQPRKRRSGLPDQLRVVRSELDELELHHADRACRPARKCSSWAKPSGARSRSTTCSTARSASMPACFNA